MGVEERVQRRMEVGMRASPTWPAADLPGQKTARVPRTETWREVPHLDIVIAAFLRGGLAGGGRGC